MFCHNCGKKIHDGVNFCPHCGKTQNLSGESLKDKMFRVVGSAISSAKTAGEKAVTDGKVQEYADKAKETAQKMADTAISSSKTFGDKVNEATDGNAAELVDKAKESASKATDTAISTAKVIGEKVNEATDGQAQVYANMAKETAQSFADDVKQVTEDKDTSKFFKKNNYRNSKVITVLIAIVVLFMLFWGNPKSFNEAVKIAEQNTSLLTDVSSINSSSIEVVGEKENTNVLFIIVDAKTKSNDNVMIGYNAFVNTKTGKIQLKTLGKIEKNGKSVAIETQIEQYKRNGLKIK